MDLIDIPWLPLAQREIELGGELPDTVLSRYGMSPDDSRRLQATLYWEKTTREMKKRVLAEGYTFAQKMADRAERLLLECYEAARVSDSLAQKLEVAKYLTKVADLEPKQNVAMTPGAGFSIIFNLGDNPPKQVSTIDATHNVVSTQDNRISNMLASLDELPPMPAWISILPFESLANTWEPEWEA